MNYNLDRLYGVDIEAYCKAHNTDIESLIKKVETDIALLKTNLHKETYKDNPDWNLVSAVHILLNKKEKHLKRLKQWRQNKPF